MRKLIYGINVSLDGCCDHTKMVASEEVHDYFTELLRNSDTLIYGRKTYELMVPFWPDMARSDSAPTRSMRDFAHAFDSVQNIVIFSRTLEDNVDDSKTRVVRGQLQDQVRTLKHQPGKNILLGGVDLPSQLIKLGLVDEFHLVVHPVIVGEGRRLFDDLALTNNLQLKLAGSRTFNSGFIALRYLPQNVDGT
jgi:dihydrofolate reductase